MAIPTSDKGVSPLNAIIQECVEAFRNVGGIVRCSIILMEDDLTHGSLRAGYDVRDPSYPLSGLKIRLKDCEILERCASKRVPILLKSPFVGGSPVLWEKVPNKKKISGIGIIPLLRGHQCFGVAGLISEDAGDDLLNTRFRSWRVIGDLFSKILFNYFTNAIPGIEKTEFEDILNGIGHGLIILDRNLIILRANSAMVDLVGRSTSELIGTSYEDLCQSGGIINEPCSVKKSIATGKITHTIMLCRAKEPEQDRYLKVSSFPQRKDMVGEVTHAIVYIRNVSAIVNAENTQKNLVHMILHDLRNPLVATVRTLDNSLTGRYGWISRHHRNTLAATRDSCELLLHMLDDMLDIYNQDAGQFKLNLEQIEVPKFIQKAYEAIEELVDEKAIRIQFDLPEGLPRIYGDETRLIRVMINLLDNAVKFSPEHSAVMIKARINSEGQLQISVTNWGRGISPEHLEKIFWKFYRVDKETGIRKAGLGLGLAFCRLTIEAHGGKIWAESPVHPDGQGSRFTFTIPPNPPERNLE